MEFFGNKTAYMSSQFINCSKCGTRNFVEEKNCGVCNEDMKPGEIQEDNSNGRKAAKIPFYFLFLLFLFVCLIIYTADIKSDKKITPQKPQDFTTQDYSTSNPATPPSKMEEQNSSYTLLEINLNNKRAFNASIRISNKITDYELKKLAQKVKSDINVVSDKGVIFFYLPGMILNSGAWAAVDFKPEPHGRFIGQSLYEENEIRKGLHNITDYVGLWSDDNLSGAVIIRIRIDKNDGYVFEYISPDDPRPNALATPLKKTKYKQRPAFQDMEFPSQYFVVETNGDLSVYDENGFFTRYRRLK